MLEIESLNLWKKSQTYKRKGGSYRSTLNVTQDTLKEKIDWDVCKSTKTMIWPQMGWFGIFLSEYALFCQFHIHMDWNYKKLLKDLSLMTTDNLFDGYFDRKSGLFFKSSWYFQPWSSNNHRRALGIHSNFISYVWSGFGLACSQVAMVLWHGSDYL